LLGCDDGQTSTPAEEASPATPEQVDTQSDDPALEDVGTPDSREYPSDDAAIDVEDTTARSDDAALQTDEPSQDPEARRDASEDSPPEATSDDEGESALDRSMDASAAELDEAASEPATGDGPEATQTNEESGDAGQGDPDETSERVPSDAGGTSSDRELTPEEVEALLAMPKQEFRFHHVHFNSADPLASAAFYEMHFAASVLDFGGASSAVQSGNQWLVFDEDEDAPAAWELTSSVFHIGFGVDSVASAHEALVEAGVESETQPFNTSQRLCTGGGGNPNVAFLYGPDHEVFEINPAGSPDFRHVHFLSIDPITTGQWYADHIGFGGATPSPSAAVNFCQDIQISPTFSVTMDGVFLLWYPVEFAHGYYPQEWEGRADLEPQRGRVLDHLAFSVADLDRAVDRLRAEGVMITRAAQSTLDGRLRSAFIAAPDEIEVEIVEGHLD
jgi:catechol 2,3-dioxygenase-like lactoylglutathione lyase family enzyme